MAPRLGGMKQKKLNIHPSTSLSFLLFYSPKPRSQVRILIYRKWSIATYCVNKRGFDCALPRALSVRRFSSFPSSILLSFSSYYPDSLHIFSFFSCIASGLEPLTFPTSRLRVSLIHHYTTKFSWDLPVKNSFLFYLTRLHCKKSTLQCLTHGARVV